MAELPVLPWLLNAVPKLGKVQAALIAVVAQVIIPVNGVHRCFAAANESCSWVQTALTPRHYFLF